MILTLLGVRTLYTYMIITSIMLLVLKSGFLSRVLQINNDCFFFFYVTISFDRRRLRIEIVSKKGTLGWLYLARLLKSGEFSGKTFSKGLVRSIRGTGRLDCRRTTPLETI